MSTINGPIYTTRHATANRVRADRPGGDRLRKQARAVAKDVQEMGGIVKDAAQEKLGQWRDNAAECYGQGQRTVHDVVCACQQFVRERPFKSILIATGVGAIAAGGVLLGRFSVRRIREQPVKSVFIAAGGGFLIGRLWRRR